MVLGTGKVAYADDVNDVNTDNYQLIQQATGYYQSGQYDKGIEFLNNAMESHSGDKLLYFERGVMYQAKGMYDQAINDCKRSLEIDPTYIKALDMRGNCYACQGKLDQAINDYNKALEIDPRCVAAFVGRGFAYVSKGMKEKGKDDFNSFLKYAKQDDPTIPTVKKMMVQFGLNTINTVELETGNHTDHKHSTQFISSVMASGFQWDITPDDLYGADKRQNYPIDRTYNIWECDYKPSPETIFAPSFYKLFASTDKISTEFSFRDNKLTFFTVVVRTANPSELQACNDFLVTAFGQPFVSRNTATWKKDNYRIEYSELQNIQGDYTLTFFLCNDNLKFAE